MRFTISRIRDGADGSFEFSFKAEPGKKYTVLDVLIDARDECPDLAFRYGCRNRLCGVCTVNINGKPKLACRTPARNDQIIEPAVGLPVLQDLVVQREGINRQLQGRLPSPVLSAEDSSSYDSLGRCIECYACLDGCPMHARNKPDDNVADGYRWGNPYSLLRVQRVVCHPGSTEADREQALSAARDFGLDSCVDCDGCTCGVGIDLMRDVINPLLEAV